MKQNYLTVALCSNRKIIHGVYLLLLSISKSTNKKVKVYLFTMNVDNLGEKGIGIQKEDYELLNSALNKFNKDNELVLIDTTDEYKKTLRNSPNNESVYTPFALTRLFMTHYINESRVIYLDIDTLAFNSLENFESINIDNHELAVVQDYLGKWWQHPDYFNSGVLYMNMDLIRESKLLEKCIQYLMKEKSYFPDQDALNYLSDYTFISSRFNNQRKIKKDTVISHYPKRVWKFWKPIKPWHVDEMRNELKIKCFDDIYKIYSNEFPFEIYSIDKPKSI